jgi:hypothetical protein
MVISQIFGGLGNQMFQYAVGRRLAQHLGVEYKLDLREFRSGSDKRPRGLEEFSRPLKLRELCVSVNEASDEEINRLSDPYANRSTWARIVRRIRRIKPDFRWPVTHIRERTYEFEPYILTLSGEVYL